MFVDLAVVAEGECFPVVLEVEVLFEVEFEAVEELPVDDAELELHFVAGERARFVAENVVHDAQLVVQADVVRLRELPAHLAVALHVPVDEQRLEPAHDLHRHDQRNRDHRVVQQQVTEPVYERVERNRRHVHFVQKDVVFQVLVVVNSVQNGAEEAQKRLEQKYRDEKLVHQQFLGRVFDFRLVRVQHDFVVVSRVQHDPEHELRVSQLGPLQQQLLDVERDGERVPVLGNFDFSFEVVQKRIGIVADDLAFDFAEVLDVFEGENFRRFQIALLQLQVLFAVETPRFDEAHSFVQGTVHQNHVRGKRLVLRDHHDFARFQLATFDARKILEPVFEHQRRLLVLGSVHFVAVDVFQQFSHQRHAQHEYYRKQRRRTRNRRYYLYARKNRCE